jgi:hypothetical protein
MTGFPAMARCGRPRGFIDWRPSAKSLALLDQVEAVLATYVEQLPLTLRQIFYRLVARYAYEKTERAFGRIFSLKIGPDGRAVGVLGATYCTVTHICKRPAAPGRVTR